MQYKWDLFLCDGPSFYLVWQCFGSYFMDIGLGMRGYGEPKCLASAHSTNLPSVGVRLFVPNLLPNLTFINNNVLTEGKRSKAPATTNQTFQFSVDECDANSISFTSYTIKHDGALWRSLTTAESRPEQPEFSGSSSNQPLQALK